MPLVLADIPGTRYPLLLTVDHPYIASALILLGASSIFSFAYSTIRFLLDTFVLPGTNLKKYGAGRGAWAVVTGASDGIGAEFAVQLAKQGFNVVLVARNMAKLQAVQAKIVQKCGVNARTELLLVDFSSASNEAYDALSSKVGSLDVGVLVNNVGRSHDMPVAFAETTSDERDAILNVNINGTLCVTQAILPGMISRKRGLVLNVGSFAGSVPTPLLATYSGSKAFLSTWSTAVAEEVRSSGVDMYCLNTFFVVSAMSKIRRSSAMVPTPQAYVHSTLSSIGLQRGSLGSPNYAAVGQVTPFWSHAICDWLLGLGARYGLGGYYIGSTGKSQADIRRRALKKAAREAKTQ